MSGSRAGLELDRPRETGLNRWMPRLVRWTAVLESPYFDLSEQGKC